MQTLIFGFLLGFWLSALVPSLTSSPARQPRGIYDDGIDDWTDDLRPVGEVGKLIQRYKENKQLVENIPSRFYEIIYPVQVRHHQKLGISTRDANDRSGKHFSQTSLLIKAFSHKLRLELELNTFLIGPQLIQKHFLPGDAQQISSQEIEHCYYHAKIKDHPGGIAAFRTCNGVSGVIHLGNETFVIHPFFGGDLSRKHPHVIYRARTKRKQKCGNSANHEWGYAHYRPQRYQQKLQHKPKNFGEKHRVKRDVREVTKYIELALILDKKMFQMRNETRLEVVNDAIQICNVADMYLSDIRTKLSVVYVETWATNNQMDVSRNVRETLLDFSDYVSKKVYKVKRDNAQMLTGQTFQNGEVGMAYPDTICTSSSVGVVEDSSLYEPHLAAVTMAHIIGHNVGMRHDDQENCKCPLNHGCIMNHTILGDQNMQPYRFTECSLNSYIETLRKGYGICLFNKPHELEDFNSCGNGIVEGDEECDCGSQQECLDKDPCCEGITCRLKKESQCASGPCCDRCLLRTTGYPCRITGDNECDIPEFCDGRSGQCPADSHKRNGEKCANGRGYCFNGKCPTRDERCINIWGYDSQSSEEKCYERFNLEGTLTGNCGKDKNKIFRKCDARDLYCGTLHCKKGSLTPMIRNMTLFSRTIIAIRGDEYECKVASGNYTGLADDFGMVPNGAKCGERMICHDKKCKSIQPFIPSGSCPSNNIALVCSGNGVCSNNNTCFCDEGWTSPQCNVFKSDHGAGSIVEPTKIVHLLPPSPTTLTHLKEAGSKFGNVPLIIIFVSAVGGVFFSFALVAICYRRKADGPKKGVGSPYSIKSLNGESENSKMENCKEGDMETSMDNSRIITFGNMPSYRQERDDKMELKRQRMRQHRQGSRESTDGSQQDEETVSFIELPPNNLSKMTEKKGILKAGKGEKDRWDEPSESDNQEICSQSDNNRGSDSYGDVEQSLKALTGYHEDILEALRNVAARSGTSYSSLSDELRKSLLSSDGFSDFDPSALFKSSPENIPGSTSNEDLAAMAAAADSVPPCGPIRIRSLEDVIRQLERHHAQVPASNRHLSPSGSEDIRLSETEADRHYHTLDGRSSGAAAVLSRGSESQGPSRGLHFKFGGSKSKHKRPISGTSSSDQPAQSTSSEGAASSHGATTYLEDESENDECMPNYLEDPLMRSASEEAFPVSQKPQYSYHSNLNYKQPQQKTLKLESCDYFPSPPSESSYTSSATQENGPFPPPPPPPPVMANGNSLPRNPQHRPGLSAAPSSSTKSVSSTGAKGKKNKKFPEYKH